MFRLPAPLRYLSELKPGKVILWCYLIWYLVTVNNPMANMLIALAVAVMAPIVASHGSPAGFRLRGPAVQGRPGGRFVYLRIGAYAGQVGTSAGWRAKIGLEGITHKLVSAAKAKRSGVLEVQFAGTGPKGGPACATVPLLGAGWYVA